MRSDDPRGIVVLNRSIGVHGMEAVSRACERMFARYRIWSARSESRTALAAIFTVGSLAVAARILGMGKEMIVAGKFGASGELDAFYIALLVPTGFTNIIGGSIAAAFIPTYLHVKQHDGLEGAKRLFGSVSMLTSIGCVTASVLALLLSRPLLAMLAPGFDSSKTAFTSKLFVVLVAMLTANGIGLTWSSLLNAEGYFSVVALSALATPAILIIALSFLPDKWGVYNLAFGTVIGAVAELAIIGWELRRRGFSLIPRWYGFNSGLPGVIGQFAPGLASGIWSSGAVIIDQSMSSMLPSGSVASLNYGARLVNAVLAVVANPLGTAILPSFSRLVALGDWVGVRRLLRNFLLLAFLAGAIPMLIIIILSHPLTVLFYQRGAFSAANADNVAHIQIAFALQIPFYLLSTVTVRLLAALRRNWIRTVGGCANLIFDILFNYWFMRYLGITGIALATSLVCVISFSFLALVLRRELNVVARKHLQAAGSVV